MRKDWIDSLKGMLIFLVVVGHVVGTAVHLSIGIESEIYRYVYKLIYLFHMPAFFFVAGLVWRHKEQSFGAFAINKFKRLMIPYYVWGVASIVVFHLASDLMGGMREVSGYYRADMFDKTIWQSLLSLLHAGGWPNGEGFRYNSVLWFLPCMFVVQLAFYWLDKLTQNKTILCLISLGLFLLDGALRVYGFPTLPMEVSICPRYVGFMALGVICIGLLEKKACYLWGFVVLAAYVGMICVFPSNLMILHKNMMWNMFGVLTAAVGSVGVAFIVNHRPKLFRFMMVLGINSFAIMLIHKFIVVGIISLGAKVSLKYLQIWVGLSIAVSIVISIMISTFFRKFCPMLIGETARKDAGR